MATKRPKKAAGPVYNRSIFINCPIDGEHMQLLEAAVFTVYYCISRTELDADSQLPRFNMPLELGVFLGAQRLGTALQRRKNCLVLDREPYRYQKFMSDIAGQDIAAHGGNPVTLIAHVRD